MQKNPKAMSLEDWIMAQSQYPAIREMKYLICNNTLKGCKVYLQDPKIVKPYLRQLSHFLLHKGVLYRQVTLSKEDRDSLQPVIPQYYQKKALQGCHDDIGHVGIE